MAELRIWTLGVVMALAGCAGTFAVDYGEAIDPGVAAGWNVRNVSVSVPETATTTERNSLAPEADIVWHGEPRGDRKVQVAAIVEEGITRGTAGLRGPRAVDISAVVTQFHGVTPRAVSAAPAAVHNIDYSLQVFDAASGAALTEPVAVQADLEAYVGAAAITAALQGQDQRTRIVAHIASVTAGVFGIGPDLRRTFSGLGR